MKPAAKFWVAVFALFVASMLAIGTASSRPGNGWTYLGSKTVKLRGDRDTLTVGSREGDFRKLQLLVRENGVFFESMNVVYSNGADDNIPLAFHLSAGGRSRIIDLRGGDRYIRRIEFRYRSVRDGDGRARVEVYARR